MVRILIFSVAVTASLLVAPVGAQQPPTDAGWEKILDAPLGGVTDIDMFDDRRGLAVGSQSILLTEDGGQTWFEPMVAETYTGGDIGWINTDSAWIVSSNGLIRRSDDGGYTWHEQQSGTDIHLQSIAVLDDQVAWATGNGQGFSDVVLPYLTPSILLHTTDGGNTWQSGPRIAGFERFGDLAFIGDDGWMIASKCAVGAARDTCDPIDNASILHTTDGGVSWSPSASPVGFLPYTLSVVDRATAYSVGETGPDSGTQRGLFRSENAGDIWTLIDAAPANPYRAHFATADRGWLANGDGTYETGDGGVTWSLLPGAPSAQALDVTTSRLILGSWGTHPLGYMEHGSFTPARSPLLSQFNSMRFFDESVGYNIDGYKTTDSGRTWSALSTPVPLVLFTAASVDVIWAVDQACAVRCDPPLYRSTDGGVTWEPIGAPFPFALSLQATSSLRAWATSGDGLWRTNDGGLTWNLVESDPQASFSDYHFLSADFGWRVTRRCPDAACDDIVLRMTLDGGDTWITRTVPRGLGVFQFVDPSVGWGYRQLPVSPDAGTGCCPLALARTTDGGMTWQDLYQTNVTSSRTYFVSRTRGWSVEPGTLRGTFDGGRTWHVESRGPAGGSFASAGNTVWLAGWPDAPAFFSPARVSVWRAPIAGGAIQPPNTGHGGSRPNTTRGLMLLATGAVVAAWGALGKSRISYHATSH